MEYIRNIQCFPLQLTSKSEKIKKNFRPIKTQSALSCSKSMTTTTATTAATTTTTATSLQVVSCKSIYPKANRSTFLQVSTSKPAILTSIPKFETTRQTRQPDKYFTRKYLLQPNQPKSICCKFIPAFENFG